MGDYAVSRLRSSPSPILSLEDNADRAIANTGGRLGGTGRFTTPPRVMRYPRTPDGRYFVVQASLSAEPRQKSTETSQARSRYLRRDEPDLDRWTARGPCTPARVRTGMQPRFGREASGIARGRARRHDAPRVPGTKPSDPNGRRVRADGALLGGLLDGRRKPPRHALE